MSAIKDEVWNDEACDCDAPSKPSNLKGKLLPLDVALARGLALAEAVNETETVSLTHASGRALAASVRTPTHLPPFDNSAMDGYAVRCADLVGGGPWRLTIAGRIAAGEAPVDATGGGALRILTGAPVPPGFDAVVMQERVERDGDVILLDRRPEPGENIRRKGEDLAVGEELLPAGVLIGAREVGALAATGKDAVAVRRKVRVKLFCTGSELVEPGEPLRPGQIWNSNRFMLLAALAQPWIDVVDLGAVSDDPAALRGALAAAAQDADMVVTTGGVSVGDEDHMHDVLRAVGGEVRVMRLALKPGKPLTIGKIGDAIYIGLPGNPVSAFVTWSIIGQSVLRKRAGISRAVAMNGSAVAAFELQRRPGRREYRPARIVGRAPCGRPLVELFDASFSARIATLAAADGFVIFPANSARIKRGAALEFAPL
ncbi:MAG: molybdopterin molybdotransferase MoeA [Neomegalonema sp.]|nr:molybdopterin molybdotransferase MoeA [Neomegalonema sp.]